MHETSPTALISICITLLGALIVTVWKAGSMVAAMTAALNELRAMVHELKIGLEHVRDFPLVKQRVEQLEDIVHKNLTSRVNTVWEKIFSLQTHVAVQEARQSRPEFASEEVGTVPDVGVARATKEQDK